MLLELWVLLVHLLTLPQPVEQWRVVFGDGRIESVLSRPAPESRNGIDHVWWWSPTMAPRRLEPGTIAAARTVEDRTRLEILVPGGLGPGASGAELVAAPMELWEELPEDLLPTWPMPPSGRLAIPVLPGKPWRLRLSVSGRGTWWTDVPAGPRAVHLAAAPAAGFRLAVVDELGRTLPGARLLATEGGGERRGRRRAWGSFRQIEGAIEGRGLPDEGEIVGFVTAPDRAPAVVRGRPSELPARIVLGPGAGLSGRVVDGKGRAVAGAEARVESTLPGGVVGYTPTLASCSADGRFVFRGLRPGPAALLVKAKGFASFRQLLTLVEGPNGVGSVTLARGGSLSLVVDDEIGQPIAGAEVEAGAGASSATDSRGRVVLEGTAVEAVEVAARARGHLPAHRHLEPPYAVPERLTLRRAFVLKGRLVGSDGIPVEGGAAHVARDGRSGDRPLDPGGRFALELEPGGGFELTLTSPATREVRLRVEAGAAGEERDLGDLRAPRGAIVLGRVVRAADGLPVAGARVWLPRPSAAGPLMAWANGDIVEARSGPDGQFRLSGLAPGPALLRVDAASLARGQVEVQAGDEAVDLGDVALGEGATLAVLAPQASGDDVLARIDLRGEGLEPDRMTEVVYDGRATFHHVPAGPVSLMVTRGRKVLCDREVSVGPEGGEVEVECRSRRMRVQGAVVAAGRPAGAGRLLWLPPAPTIPTGVNTVVSPGGLVEQEVFDTSPPDVEIEVAPDGRFASEDLTPGRWQVVWTAADGGRSSTRTIELPDVESYSALVELSGGVVSGEVVDREGKAVADARVRLLGDGTTVLAGADGSFAFTGLDPGRYAFQARAGELESSSVEVELAANSPGAPLRLVVERPHRAELHLSVVHEDGAPAGGAFVFMEEAGRGMRLLTADGDGHLSVAVGDPQPAQVRFAATTGSDWGFTAWQAWDALGDGVVITTETGGSLRVESRNAGVPEIVRSDGWNLSVLLTQLGSRPAVGPSSPLDLRGLPSGDYVLSLGGERAGVTLRPGEQARVEIGR